MKYFDDMNSKYGFEDGEAVPDGVEIYREVYIKAINAAAERLGCTQRAVPYDRPGVHNWCLISFEPGETGEPDAKMAEAIDLCRICDWDSFVRTETEIVEGFEAEIPRMLDQCQYQPVRLRLRR